MSRQELLTKFVTTELLIDPQQPIGPDDDLLTTGRMDSLGLMRLVSFIADEFDIAVPYQDILIENFRSVSAIDAYLGTRDAE